MHHALMEQESAEDDALRMAKVTMAWLKPRIEALTACKFELTAETGAAKWYAERMRRGDVFDAAEVNRVKDLLWKYRREIPPALRLKLPPRDPIVMEMGGE